MMAEQTTDISTLSFEHALKELDEIVKRLEGGQGALETAIEDYERGTALKDHCLKTLDAARLRVEKIMSDGSGGIKAVPFEPPNSSKFHQEPPVPFDLQQSIQDASEALEHTLDQLIPEVENDETRLVEAMRYSALSGGKRLRPFLVLATADLFGVSRESALQTAAAIELIHTYSLIHDDLPAMDNDDLRRGKPSSHIVFGEATAILAGDALLTLSFQVLADPDTHPDPGVRCELVRCLAQAAGYRGMVGGQAMDMFAEKHQLELDEVIRLQRMKTGELFAIACETGAILGKAPQALRNALRRYAHSMGLAFQIRDDLLDAEGSREATGKGVRKDETAGKVTLVTVMGIERAREQSQILTDQAISHLDVFDKKADLLRELSRYIIQRNR